MRYIVLTLPFHHYYGDAVSDSQVYENTWAKEIKELSRKVSENIAPNVKIIHSEDAFARKDADAIASRLGKRTIKKMEPLLRRHGDNTKVIESILSPKENMETDVLVIASHPEVISYFVDHFIKERQCAIVNYDAHYAGYVIDCKYQKIHRVPLLRASVKH